MKCLNENDYSYKLYDFELNKSERIKSSLSTVPTSTSSLNKKLSYSTNLNSSSYTWKRSTSLKKRQDVTSSSGAGDSGVSDCESSSNNYRQHKANLTNIQTLCSSTNQPNKTTLIVQDLPLKRTIKSQLSISRNSAFTKILKQPPQQER